jgi:hypothetical protein
MDENDFDEFAKVVGSDKIPEYIFVRIRHPFGMYIKEVICPDGTRVPYDMKNPETKEWITDLHHRIRKKEAKYKPRMYRMSKQEFFNLWGMDKKADEIIKRQRALEKINDKNKR